MPVCVSFLSFFVSMGTMQLRDQLNKEVELRVIAEDAESAMREQLKEAESWGNEKMEACKALDGHRCASCRPPSKRDTQA